MLICEIASLRSVSLPLVLRWVGENVGNQIEESLGLGLQHRLLSSVVRTQRKLVHPGHVLRNQPPDLRLAHRSCVERHAGHELVDQAVLESGVELWREPVLVQVRDVLLLGVPVDQQIRFVAVDSNQQRLLQRRIRVGVKAADELVRDAIGEELQSTGNGVNHSTCRNCATAIGLD